MAANRKTRRKARHEMRAGARPGAVTIEIIELGDILSQSVEHLAVVGGWVARVTTGLRCMTCSHEWWAREPLPAAFAFIRHWEQAGARLLVSGLCGRCCRRPNLTSRVEAALKQKWPDFRVVGIAHPGTRVLQ